MTISQKAATAGPVLVACASTLAGVHSPNRRWAEGIWSGTGTWLRRPGVRTWLARAAQRRLIGEFKDLGADPACETPKFFRFLGSINSKTGRKVSIVREFADKDGWIACYRSEDLFRELLEDRGLHVAVRERKIQNYEKTGRRWKREKQEREQKKAALVKRHQELTPRRHEELSPSLFG